MSDVKISNLPDGGAVQSTDTIPAVRGAGNVKVKVGTAGALNVAASGDAASSEVVKGNDTRLTNARTPVAHTHAMGDVVGLSLALDGKEAVGTAASVSASAVIAHVNAADPHPNYTTSAEVSTAIAAGVTAHTSTANPHPEYALDSDLTAALTSHNNASDPHPGYVLNAELTAAITTHSEATDPHPGYVLDAQMATAISTALSSHTSALDPHPDYVSSSELASAFSGHNSASDPHPGYLLESDLGSTISTAISAHTSASDPHPGYVLDSDLASSIGAAITAHNSASDPHAGYVLNAELTAAISGHTSNSDAHPGYVLDAELSNALAAHVNDGDPHPAYALESAVATALANKADSNHGHTSISGITITGTPSVGQVLKATSGTSASWAADDTSSGAGATNLSYSASPTNGVVNSSSGDDATIPLATGVNAGLMSPGFFNTLNNIGATGADLIAATTPAEGRTELELGTAATLDVAVSGNATASQVVKGNDARLSDARTPTAHNHAISDITGLTDALANKESAGSVAAHESASDPHPGYVLNAELTGAFSAHTIAADPHPGYVLNAELTAALAGKADTAHAHNVIAGITISGVPDVGQVLKATSATAASWSADNTDAGSGITNLSYTASALDGVVVSSTGDDATIPLASGALAGLLSPGFFNILNGSGATGRALFAATTVTAAHTALELGNVVMLSVPSTGNASASQVVKGDDTRLTNARTPTAHNHAISDVTGLSDMLGDKEDVGTASALLDDHATATDPHPSYALESDVASALANKADSNHGHSVVAGITITGTPSTGQVLKATSTTAATWQPDATGASATNLSYTAAPTNGTVVSDTGTDATIPLVTGTNAGLMSPAQYNKLADIDDGATSNTDTDTLPEGTQNLYFTDGRVRSAALNGVDTAITDSAIVSGDSVLTALRKLIARFVAYAGIARSWTAAQRGAPVSVAYAGTITLNFAAANNFEIGTLTGNLLLNSPDNVVAGQSGVIWLTQDAQGGRLIALHSNFKPAGDQTYSTIANSVTHLGYIVKSPTYIQFWVVGPSTS